ncbi:hypothetical protein Q8A67_025065 [Cirrhinus molitorella]|uniref:Uncharacterized protein n=1 Tax=Cirrhinus molitorella TaxID=172907 RepID=A0AA88NZ46_9TELE|nr:hypothetical protein Q8A67_025065 [Cirrhinus molitorella]
MSRIMSSALLGKFSMRDGGQLEKKPFKDAVKRWSPNATDAAIDAAMEEQLNHTPGRAPGREMSQLF